MMYKVDLLECRSMYACKYKNLLIYSKIAKIKIR